MMCHFFFFFYSAVLLNKRPSNTKPHRKWKIMERTLMLKMCPNPVTSYHCSYFHCCCHALSPCHPLLHYSPKQLTLFHLCPPWLFSISSQSDPLITHVGLCHSSAVPPCCTQGKSQSPSSVLQPFMTCTPHCPPAPTLVSWSWNTPTSYRSLL